MRGKGQGRGAQLHDAHRVGRRAQLEVALTVEDLVLPDEISQVLDEVSAPTLSYPEKSFG